MAKFKNQRAGRTKVDDNFLNLIDSQDKAYVLGLWYADGTNYEDKGIIKIDLVKSDRELLEKLKTLFSYEGTIKTYVNRTKYFDGVVYECQDSCRLRMASKNLSKQLANKGCIQNKTYVLKFPNEDVLPKEYLKDFIRGYMDGDGNISYWIDNKNTGHKKFQVGFCGTIDIIDNISKILANKFNCCPCKTDRYPDRNNNNIQVSVCGNRVVRDILDWLYEDANIYMQRKYDKYLELLEENKRVDEDDNLYGNAYKPRQIIRLSDGKIYKSMGKTSKDNNCSVTKIFKYCKKKDTFMYLDEYNKEVINGTR